MQFFGSGLFWLIEGMLLCAVIFAFKLWMEDRRRPMTVGKWILLGIWALLFGFTISFIGTNLGENETGAALRGGFLFGSITVASGAVLWFLFNRGRDK